MRKRSSGYCFKYNRRQRNARTASNKLQEKRTKSRRNHLTAFLWKAKQIKRRLFGEVLHDVILGEQSFVSAF